MRPNKKGQIAKFHTPLPDENPEQLYVVLELVEDDDRPRTNGYFVCRYVSKPLINQN
jgi:hypothetical protein